MTERPKRIRIPTKSVRLKQGQAPILKAAAAAYGLSENAYIQWRVFDPETPPPKPRKRLARLEEKFAAQVVGLLGQTRIPNNLNQIASLGNKGLLDLTPEVLAQIAEALGLIHDIHSLTYRALGLSEVHE